MDPDLWVSKGPYVYEQVIPFSSIRGNASSGWYPWEDRCVRISGAAELIALKPEVAAIDPLSSLAARNERFIVDCLDASKVEIVEVDYEEDPDGQVLDLQGLVIKCSTLSDEDTCFRVLLNKTDIRPFVRALRIVSKYHNLDKVWTTQLRVTRSEDGDGSILLPYFMSRNNRSVVRRSVMFVKGPGDMRTRQQRIMWKRGAFKFLPIFFHSDQLHGACCLLVGSTLSMVASVVALEDQLWGLIGDRLPYISSSTNISAWMLILLTGSLACTSSILYIRAFYETPFLAPIFSVYHLSSDELVASWLLCGSTIPFTIFSVLFFVCPSYQALLYIVSFLLGVILLPITYLLVRSCYPSSQHDPQANKAALWLKRLGAVISQHQQEHYLANDWLAAWWGIFHVQALLLLISLGHLTIAIYNVDASQVWVFSSLSAACIACLMGSAYMIAGAYSDRPYRPEALRGRKRTRRKMPLLSSLSSIWNDVLRLDWRTAWSTIASWFSMESMEEDDHEAPSALSSESIQKKKASSNSTTVELQTLEEKTDFWQEMVGQVRRHRLSQGLPGTYTP